ncbi:MAG: hypothetical protein R3B57_00315 [Phycisphaerales bacterium]
MKKVLGWIKGHLLIVICALLIVTFLPAGYVVSGMWNAKIKKTAQDDFKKEQNKLRGKSSVNYALPVVFENEKSVSEARAPNRATTEFFAREKAAREEQVAKIVEDATAFNSRGHVPLVPDLLPKPPSDEARRTQTVEMVRAISGESAGDGVFPLFRRLLDRINAGPPIPAEDLADSLSEYERAQREKLEAASPTGKLSQEQEDELKEQLVRQRLGAYASRAGELSMYASPDVVRIPAQGGLIPFEPDPARVGYTEDDAFRWQFDIWLVEDILAGLDKANTEATGERASIIDAPVKRLELLEILPFNPADGGSTPGAAPTHTGRGAGGARVYDVRHARLTLVADADRIPQVIDALGASNFITVTSMRATRVDPWAELDGGYYYGPGAVLRLNMDVEVVYLRDWTKKYMPPAVRQALGIPDDAPDQAKSDD